MTPEQTAHILVGAVLLLFGRRVFWLFVAGVGFLVGFELAEQILGVEPGWAALAIGGVLGVATGLFAMFFQLVAAAVAGFAVGVYAAAELVGTATSGWLAALCGVVGAIVAVSIFGWALVLLSALAGAASILDAFELAPATRLVAFVALAAVGIAVQSAQREPRRLQRG